MVFSPEGGMIQVNRQVQKLEDIAYRHQYQYSQASVCYLLDSFEFTLIEEVFPYISQVQPLSAPAVRPDTICRSANM